MTIAAARRNSSTSGRGVTAGFDGSDCMEVIIESFYDTWQLFYAAVAAVAAIIRFAPAARRIL